MTTQKETLEAKELREWLWNIAIDNVGDETFYYSILNRSGITLTDGPLSPEEQEYAGLFRDLVNFISYFLGDEDKAAQWIFSDDSEFCRVTKTTPYEYLNEGGFWTLCLLRDLFEVAWVRRGIDGDDEQRAETLISASRLGLVSDPSDSPKMQFKFGYSSDRKHIDGDLSRFTTFLEQYGLDTILNLQITCDAFRVGEVPNGVGDGTVTHLITFNVAQDDERYGT